MKRFFLKTLIAAVAVSAMGLATAQDIKSRTIKFATQNPKGHPLVTGAEKFAELVSARSGGKLKVNVFAGGVLGGDAQNISALQGGTLEMMVMNSGILANVLKEFSVFDFPFMFANAQEADAVVDGPFGKMMHDRLDAKGIHGLAYWELGFRNITNGKRPINKVEDIAGLKLRVIQSPIYVDMFSALGANPTPLAWPEVYSALEQKAVDGQENPSTTIRSAKLNEVQKHLAQTRHVYNPQSLIFSKKLWDKLSADEKKIIADAATEATTYERQVSRQQASEAIEELKKSGMQVTEIAPAELQRMRDKVKPVIDKYSAQVGPDTVKALYAEIAKVRK